MPFDSMPRTPSRVAARTTTISTAPIMPYEHEYSDNFLTGDQYDSRPIERGECSEFVMLLNIVAEYREIL